MNPFPAVARGALNPGGDSDMTAAAGIPFPPMHAPSEARKLLRDVALFIAASLAVLAIMGLLTWALCELQPLNPHTLPSLIP